jgi:hypothetical protein
MSSDVLVFKETTAYDTKTKNTAYGNCEETTDLKG